jgi:hypothetical protein
MDTRKCVQKPAGTEYNKNMRKFLVPQASIETNPGSKRYISANKLTDSNTTNCNSSFPYYDGISCIQCLSPFDIFNVDEKKCVACNND